MYIFIIITNHPVFALDLYTFVMHFLSQHDGKKCLVPAHEIVNAKHAIIGDKLGEFTMVSQPIRLILVDWFVFHFFEVIFHFFYVVFLFFFFFLGRLPFYLFFEVVFHFLFFLRLSSIFFCGRHSSFKKNN